MMTDAVPAPPATGSSADAARILEATRYLDQCRRAGRAFAVLIGTERASTRAAIDAFLADLPADCRVARMPAPTDSSHAFLEAVLAQFGFEPFDSTADDLQRLLTVVLRQGAGRDVTRTLIVAEDAQDFGPRVLEMIRELARNSRDITPAPLLVLAGHNGLNRVLDSRGMASVAALTGLRFDFADEQPLAFPFPPEAVPAASQPDTHPTLELSLNHDLVGRFPVTHSRLLIGRSQHSDICIASRFVSRQHALLVRNPDGDWLIDLNSTNGTSVNSQLIEHRRLIDGDVISIGNYRLHYENPAGHPLAPPAHATREQLSETMVMRSLRALRDPEPEPDASGSASSAA
jgi:hypothetical protein